MTGWIAEQRAEGIAMIATDEQDTDLPCPRLRAADFAALMILDELLRRDRDRGGDGSVDNDQIGRAVAEVQARYPRAMTVELRADATMRLIATELLTALDLLRPSNRRLPADTTARFRNPAVVSVTARLDEDQECAGRENGGSRRRPPPGESGVIIGALLGALLAHPGPANARAPTGTPAGAMAYPRWCLRRPLLMAAAQIILPRLPVNLPRDRPVTVAAIMTRTAATRTLMIHRIQSIPDVAATPRAPAT
jgi:hypothetical protein